MRAAFGATRGVGVLGLLVLLAVLGVLANLAVPAYRLSRLERRAETVLAEVVAVQQAVVSYRHAEGHWPAERPAGHVPPGLARYLERELAWRQHDVVYDWENWLAPDGTSRRPETGMSLGVSVRTSNPRLGILLQRRAESPTHAVWGFGVTLALPTDGE